jgi:hypothetical protein
MAIGMTVAESISNDLDSEKPTFSGLGYIFWTS